MKKYFKIAVLLVPFVISSCDTIVDSEDNLITVETRPVSYVGPVTTIISEVEAELNGSVISFGSNDIAFVGFKVSNVNSASGPSKDTLIFIEKNTIGNFQAKVKLRYKAGDSLDYQAFVKKEKSTDLIFGNIVKRVL